MLITEIYGKIKKSLTKRAQKSREIRCVITHYRRSLMFSVKCKKKVRW